MSEQSIPPPQTRAPVVVGVDGSDQALHAVTWAAREAARRQVPLQLVHAMLAEGAGWIGYGGVGLPPEHFVTVRRAGEGYLAHAHEVASALLPSESIGRNLVEQMPVSALLDLSHSAGLLVVGPRGSGGFASLLLGSTAAAVASHAACPVVVTRGATKAQARADAPVVVGVDGSPTSEGAVAWAFDAASRRGVALLAIHVWSDLSTQLVGSWFDWEKTQGEEEVLLSQRLAGWREDYPDVPVTSVVYPDRPAQALLEQSHVAQLLVVGSRGRGGFAGALLGSTSRAMLHHAACPVMVVRHEK